MLHNQLLGNMMATFAPAFAERTAECRYALLDRGLQVARVCEMAALKAVNPMRVLDLYGRGGVPRVCLGTAANFLKELYPAWHTYDGIRRAMELTIRFERDVFRRPEVSVGMELESIIRDIKNAVVGGIQKKSFGDQPRLCLLGPGRSKTDPVYAKLILDSLYEDTGRRGSISIYDKDEFGLAKAYLRKFAWGPHRSEVRTGPDGHFDHIPAQKLFDVMVVFHPASDLSGMGRLFSQHVRPGGVVVWQLDTANIPANFEEYFDRTFQRIFGDQFHVLRQWSGPVFDTPFSRAFAGQTRGYLLQKCTPGI